MHFRHPNPSLWPLPSYYGLESCVPLHATLTLLRVLTRRSASWADSWLPEGHAPCAQRLVLMSGVGLAPPVTHGALPVARSAAGTPRESGEGEGERAEVIVSARPEVASAASVHAGKCCTLSAVVPRPVLALVQLPAVVGSEAPCAPLCARSLAN
jgi:hypothetical protein